MMARRFQTVTEPEAVTCGRCKAIMGRKPEPETMPEIVINSPGARFVIHFDRTAEYCWRLTWPSFTDEPVGLYRSLESAMGAIAVFVGETEF